MTRETFKNSIFKQKKEKERLLSLPYIDRTASAKSKKWFDSDLIKVVTGPRRAGKSIFCLTLLKDRQFAYFNFDDEVMQKQDKFNYDNLIQELHACYGETKTILFDEIQNLPGWELFVNRLHRNGYNLILTGSNSRLLSQELSTALTGRHIPIEILPFNLKEFLLAKKYNSNPSTALLPEEKGKLLYLLEQYLTNGGYPEVCTKDIDPAGYLDVLFDAILFKDVINRHKVRFSGDIDNLGAYLVNNFSCLYTLRKTADILRFRSGVTLEKYISYLTEAYLIFSLNCYSYKIGERLKSPRKSYVVDNGFITAKNVSHSPNTGKLLESLVFTELLKSGFEANRHLFYYKTKNNYEIDFMLKSGPTVTELIQVAHELNNPNVEKREIRALLEAGRELNVKNLTILTWDEKRNIKVGDASINLTPFWERFLA